MGLFGDVVDFVTSPFKGNKKAKEAEKNTKSAVDQYRGMVAPNLSDIRIQQIGAGTVGYDRARAGQAAYAPTVRAAQGTLAARAKAGQAAMADRAKAGQAGYSDMVRAGQADYAPLIRARMLGANQSDIQANVLDQRDMLRSEFEDYYEDPRMRNAQADALARYEQLAREGMSDEDKAALYGIQKTQEKNVRAQREGIERQMLMRGTYGSGLGLAMQLQGAQDENELAAMQGMDVLAQSSANRRNALAGYAGLAGDIRQQDFGQFATRAQALDDMSRYNEDNAFRYEMANADFDLRAKLANQDSQLRARLANQATDLQAQMANQGMQADVGMFNAGQRTQASMANQDMQTQVNVSNAANRNQRNLAYMGLQGETNMFNAGQRTQVNLGNMQAANQMSMFNAGERNQVGVANMNMRAQTNQFNAGQRSAVSMNNSGLSLQQSMANVENQMKAQMFNSSAGEREQMYAREAQQWTFNTQLGIADRRAAAYLGVANMNMQQAARSDAQLAMIINGAMMAFGG